MGIKFITSLGLLMATAGVVSGSFVIKMTIVIIWWWYNVVEIRVKNLGEYIKMALKMGR